MVFSAVCILSQQRKRNSIKHGRGTSLQGRQKDRLGRTQWEAWPWHLGREPSLGRSPGLEALTPIFGVSALCFRVMRPFLWWWEQVSHVWCAQAVLAIVKSTPSHKRQTGFPSLHHRFPDSQLSGLSSWLSGSPSRFPQCIECLELLNKLLHT